MPTAKTPRGQTCRPLYDLALEVSVTNAIDPKHLMEAVSESHKLLAAHAEGGAAFFAHGSDGHDPKSLSQAILKTRYYWRVPETPAPCYMLTFSWSLRRNTIFHFKPEPT